MTTTNLPGPITPIEVRVRPYTAPEERLRFRWQQDPAGQPYRDAAIAWLTRRLREPVYESAGIIASDTLDPVDTRARWWTVREHLGELDRLTVTEHRDLGPVQGHGIHRVELSLIAIGSSGAANFVVRVSFSDGPANPPESVLQQRPGRRPAVTPARSSRT